MNLFLLVLVAVVVISLIWTMSRRRSRALRNGSSATFDLAPNKQIYVGNVPYRLSESKMRDFFSAYGEIEKIRLIKDRRTGRSKGFGFVTYTDLGSSAAALDAHEQELGGRMLIVRYAKPATPSE